MKSFRITLLIMLLSTLSFQYISAQTPAISTKYSNAEIDQLMKAFKIEHSHRATPTQLLQQKFKTDFPGAYDIEWKKAAKLYEVEFEIKRLDYEAYYDEQGNLVMYKHDISQSDLPEAIKTKLKSLYPNYRFDDIEKMVKGTETSYKVEMEKGDMDVKIIIKSDGTIVSKLEDYD